MKWYRVPGIGVVTETSARILCFYPQFVMLIIRKLKSFKWVNVFVKKYKDNEVVDKL